MPSLSPDQFGIPETGSEWTHTATGKPAKVLAVTSQPTLDLKANTLTQGQHRVWVERPHPQKAYRQAAFSLEDFHRQHTKRSD